jgi:uncharacterized protein (TIGR02147 family)
MTPIFEFNSYRMYLQSWIEKQGDKAFGIKGRMARHMGISSSLFSQIMKEEKELTMDQASDLIDFLGLNELESDFFGLLVESSRAGNPRYRNRINMKMEKLKNEAKKISKRVQRSSELTDIQRAIFYSSWIYSGILNLIAVPQITSACTLATHLKVDEAQVRRALQFLIEHGLCKDEGGRLVYGPASTHVDADSPFVNKHHQNWRIKALQTMESKNPSHLFFTAPMSLSAQARDEIRANILQFIQSTMAIVGPSPSEKVACLNIDWFDY